MAVELHTSMAPAPLERPSILPILYVTSGALQAFDAYSTISALHRGAVEANPLMGGVVTHPGLLIGVKASVVAGSIFTTEQLWRGHHRLAAIALMAGSNGVMAFVAAHNAAVSQQLGR
jgi:hypothetical protein